MSVTAPPRPPAREPAPGRVSAPRAVAAIVVTALRRVARDRVGLFFIVVLPFIIILLFGAGAGDGRDSSLPVGVVGDASGGALMEALEAEPALAIQEFDDADALTGAVRRRDVVGGVVVSGAAEGAVSGGTVQARWVGDPASEDGPAARIAVESAIAELDARLVALRVAVDELGLSAEEARAAAAGVREEPLLMVEQERTAEESLSFGVDESSQHNLVLFVFITSLTGGAALIESRRLGTAQRMLASPASAATVLIGEAPHGSPSPSAKR